MTLTLLFAGGGEAADAAGKILPPDPPSQVGPRSLRSTASPKMSSDVKCVTHICVVCEIIVRHGRFAPLDRSSPQLLIILGWETAGSGLSLCSHG